MRRQWALAAAATAVPRRTMLGGTGAAASAARSALALAAGAHPPTPITVEGSIPIPGRLGVGSGTLHHGVGVGGGGLLGGSGGIMSGSGGDGGHLRDDLMLSGAGVGSFGGGAMSVTLGNTPGEMAMLLGGGHTPVGCSIDLDHAVGGGEAGMDFSPSNFLSLYASPSERMLTLMQHPK